MTPALEQQIKQLPGPVLVLGASGFVGANLFRSLLSVRPDVHGTSSTPDAWRLNGLPSTQVMSVDLLVERNLAEMVQQLRPRTVFDCVAYGAYSFEQDSALIFRTNVGYLVRLVEELQAAGVQRYIHAGSSSEYGESAAGPKEESFLRPNSAYAASKAAASEYLYYMGKKRGFPCANLRLYSVYGPWEDSSRLMPAVVMQGLSKAYPPLVNPAISRDFVYADDVSEAFVAAAARLQPEHYGESFNIGSGRKSTVGDIAATAKSLFQIPAEPAFSTMEARAWDLDDWYAEPEKAKRLLGWEARTPLDEGLRRMADWVKGLPDLEAYKRLSKRFGLDRDHSVTAVIACYKDGQAIPIMHQRLKQVFAKLNLDHEIIFVNDNSPDSSETVIQELSRQDRHVLGITHSRNFGSQAAFRSGMELSSKNAVVLLDGDLQDPPELIEAFVEKWREGYEVVYGRRVKRQAPWLMQLAYKAFYRLFDRFSYIAIPHDAGDFALMDRSVVRSLLRFPERDLFMRGIRAFAGFKQTGVDYVRPERMFGVTTNSLLKNIGWAKKGILSFSTTPLDVMSFTGVALFILSGLLAAFQVLYKLANPQSAPQGTTTTLLLITFFGSLNLLAASIIGEYIAKILEEVKGRPHFIRRHIIRDGEVRAASKEG
jgi:dolichol-phosphate mannosyltransferase